MCSLEVRAPFLDNDLAAFCQRLPSAFKYRNGERKWLLKQALRPWLPEATLARRKKGFGVPTATWLRQWRVPSVPGNAALGAGAPQAQALGQLWERHRRGQADERLLLFAWLGMTYNLERLSDRPAYA
jgi:asparagine synthase (glutamine-hydrolysing)